MQIVIDTIDPEGKCRALVVEALRCDGETLFVRKGTCDLEVSVLSHGSCQQVHLQVVVSYNLFLFF